jgi:hypothetical protein
MLTGLELTISRPVAKMKPVHLRRVGSGLALFIVFSLLYIQLSADPCPFHDRPTAHARATTVSCPASMCLCFLHTYCPPAVTWSFQGSLAVRASREFSTEPAFRPFYLAIFHPPRSSRPV